jgi:hypothetical protein
VSLLGKWLPSSNTSSAETRKLAGKFMAAFGLRFRAYRKLLVSLRAKIAIVEAQMSAKQFSKINYEAVPSRASMIYRKSFSKQDATRYQNYLESVKKGESKINSGTLYPYDIVRSCLGEYNETLELQWNNLPNYCKESSKTLCVVDVSGSMSMARVGNVRPIDVSLSLGLYTAERCEGPFKNCMITFSHQPELVKIVGNNLHEKLKFMLRTTWNMNTDLLAVFKLILNTAVANRLNQSDLPDNIMIISDMQFDSACGSSNLTTFQIIDNMFRNAGYIRPGIVFWNVNAAGSKNSPVTIDDNGVCLVSGCSPSILTTVLGNELNNPVEIMLKTINVQRYDAISV